MVVKVLAWAIKANQNKKRKSLEEIKMMLRAAEKFKENYSLSLEKE